MIERAETEKYEIQQGNIVAVGTGVPEEMLPVLRIGDIAVFNKYHISAYEIEYEPGKFLKLDSIHTGDLRWVWPE